MLLFVAAADCDGLCHNGGSCVAPDTCICQQGFTGKRCETGEGGWPTARLNSAHIDVVETLTEALKLSSTSISTCICSIRFFAYECSKMMVLHDNEKLL